MAKTGRRAIKIIVTVFILLVAGGFAVNWYLTYRLQSKLKKVLSEEVSKATDGFYSFSFDNLKVGLFSGELSIQGIELIPDSAVFNQWQQGDSLPDVYYDIHVGEIHFKGINLTWLTSYKKLNFSLFEIKSPDIKIYDPTEDVSAEKTVENKELGTLYEIVSPYIDILTVSRINLSDANVSYTVEDSISPVIYALRDANFRAYNFRLDENSSVSGKLLYCDDFEFIADKSQELLYSNEIILKTENIKLSTIESLIQIDGVHIFPKESYWNERSYNGGSFLKADIKSVEVKGVKFRREEGLNYLDATSFDISSTDIEYYNIKDKSQKEEKDKNQKEVSTDSTYQQAWSLYTVLSPILQSITIDKIGVEKTKFNYTITNNGYTDVYKLGQFDFHANNFLINSISEKQKKFWYVDDFTLIGDTISGLMESNNADLSVSKLLLSTTDKKFSISDIKIKPMSTKSKEDYISGSIKSISIDGLDYTTGVSAEQLKIESANIAYFKVTKKREEASSDEKVKMKENILDFFTPYADFLSVKKINLSDANFVVNDKNMGEIYRLNHLKFYATKFLVDEQTKMNSRFLFTFEDIGLSFRDFDNLLPEGDYRLKIKNADVSSLTGKILLENVKLIPQLDTWKKEPDTYYSLEVPLFEIKGFNYSKYLSHKDFEMNSIHLDSPNVSIVKSNSPIKKDNGDKNDSGFSSILSQLKVKVIDINNTNLAYFDKIVNDSLQAKLQTFHINTLQWDIKQKFSIDEIVLQAPEIDYISNQEKEGDEVPSASLLTSIRKFTSNINIGKFSVSTVKANIKQTDTDITADIQKIDFSGLDWNMQNGKSHLNLAALNISKPYLSYDRKYQIKTDTAESSKSLSKDIYTTLNSFVNTASIGEFNITDANVNYIHSLDEKSQEHQTVNNTNLDVDGLKLNTDDKKVDFADIQFYTKDFSFSIMDGFYTLRIGKIDINTKKQLLALSDLHMDPVYAKTEFAYKHPKHKDWFDVSAGDVILTGVDFPVYFSDKVLKAKKLNISKVLLQNFKNQQIEIQHNIMPLIYEKIQHAPLKMDIDSLDVSDFSVMYEELPKKGDVPGKIYFDNMNGKIAGFTNIPSYPDQYMRLDADGKFMGKGYFTAKWYIPVSPDYDCFILEARMHNFDLMALNDIFTPLARAELKKGMLKDFEFRTEASSKEANAHMLFLYNDLEINLLKGDDNEHPNKFLSGLANAVIRSNNPNKEKSKPREANIYIKRDPYHSTFNYFWQILQPSMVESVGVSQGTQNFVKKVGGFFSKVKNFFTGKKEDKKVEPNQSKH